MRTICFFWGWTLLVASAGFAQRPSTMPQDSLKTYEIAWRHADSLRAAGRLREALAFIAQIRQKALAEGTEVQVVKAMREAMGIRGTIEADADSAIVAELKADIAQAPLPRKQVLQCFLADLYAQYAKDYYWEVSQRTPTGSLPEDYRAWGMTQFAQECARLYLASVSPGLELMQIPARNWQPLLHTAAGSEAYRPTLFDLLAHHALAFFFSGSIVYEAGMGSDFSLTAAQGLADTEAFAQMQLDPGGQGAPRAQALQMYQRLLNVHRQRLVDLRRQRQFVAGVSDLPLLDLELHRLDYAHGLLTEAGKDEAYLAALGRLQAGLPGGSAHPMWAEIAFVQLRFRYGQDDWQPASQPPAGSPETPGRMNLRDIHRALDSLRQQAAPGSRAAHNAATLMAHIEAKALRIEVEDGNLPGAPFRVLVGYRNLEQVHFRAIRITDRLEKALEALQNDYTHKQAIELLARETPAQQWQATLRAEGDFRPHTTEVAAPGLPPGEYYLLASPQAEVATDRDGAAFAACSVSGLLFVRREAGLRTLGLVADVSPEKGTNAGEWHLLLDRGTGAPVAGAEVREYVRKRNREGRETAGTTHKTDENGMVFIPLKSQEEGYRLKGTRGVDVAWSQPSYYYGWRRDFDAATETQARAFFFLDRAIYRPGQTIQFKCMAVEETRHRYRHEASRLLANTPITLILKDANSQEVARQVLTTNSFGTCSGTFTAPARGLAGVMYIEAENMGSTALRVEEYKRPKFEVAFDTLKGNFALNQTAELTLTAQSFSGANIDGAQVKFRVEREAQFPDWGYWWRPRPRRPAQRIANGTLTTDAQGRAVISFPLMPDPALAPDTKPVFAYTVSADVVDLTGETHSASITVRAGYVSLEARLTFPETLDPAADLAPWELRTANLNGIPQPATGSVTVYALTPPHAQPLRPRHWPAPDRHLLPEAEYRRLFPHDRYANEDRLETWQRGPALFQRAFDTGKDERMAVKADLAGLKPGQYVAVMTTADPQGNPITSTRYFTLRKPGTPPVVPTALATGLSRASIAPGQQTTWALGSSADKVWVLAEQVYREQVLSRRWVQVDRGAATADFAATDALLGGFHIQYLYCLNNAFVASSEFVDVPWPEKDLRLQWATFRDKLQPGQPETWKLRISGSKAEQVAAEMVATLYDASLDAFGAHSFEMPELYPSQPFAAPVWDANMSAGGSGQYDAPWRIRQAYSTQGYDRLSLIESWIASRFELTSDGPNFIELREDETQPRVGSNKRGQQSEKAVAYLAPPPLPPPPSGAMLLDEGMNAMLDAPDSLSNGGEKPPVPAPPADLSQVKVRTNLNETAFFFPHLQTDAEGGITLAFTMPEALTRWNFLGLAHTQSLALGTLRGSTVTQKELMVMPNLPRFLREGDRVTLTAKVVNLTARALNGTAEIRVRDLLTGRDVTAALGLGGAQQPFAAAAGQSALVAWQATVPEGMQAVAVQMVAGAGAVADGEENPLPVLTNRMLVTESLPLWTRGSKERKFTFTKLAEASPSPSLRHHALTLEYTSNPAWYAVAALPYLMEYPHECTEQLFSRLYANAIATQIAHSSPRIRAVFDAWRTASRDSAKSALASNLATNEALKNVLLEETPWVMAAQGEAARKQRLALLLDLERMAVEFAKTADKLAERQQGDGSFSWFPGMGRDAYVTRLIATGLGELRDMGVQAAGTEAMRRMMRRAAQYCEAEFAREYARLAAQPGFKPEENHLSHAAVQHLYMRSLHAQDLKPGEGETRAVEFYTAQARKFWNTQSPYMQGMLAIACIEMDDLKTAGDIINALKQRAVQSEEMGMYWKSDTRGWWWYEAPIETHALLTTAFIRAAKAGIASATAEDIDALRAWLIKHKQTHDWETTRATVAACNALLMGPGSPLDADAAEPQPQVGIALGGTAIDPAALGVGVEAGTGYFTTSWRGAEVQPELGRVTLTPPKSGSSVSYGALHWQYFEQLDRITPAATPVRMEKQLMVEAEGKRGPVLQSGARIRQGDKVVVRLEIRVDRDMEYVHLKDLRAAGFEPIGQLSGYKWGGGLGWYESPRDAATHFFFGYLPRGVHVFEYPLRATHSGDFSNGMTQLQCMYAPEFSAHSAGVRVVIE